MVSAGCSCYTQCPAPPTMWQPSIRVHAASRMVSRRPGFRNGPQLLAPAMNVEGTSIVRPE